MKKFDRELANLKQRVVEMGELARSMVAAASRALLNGDGEGIRQVREAEPALDRFQIDSDREAIRLITIYSPVAKDLRFLLMIVRITSEFERIGDQAMDACEYGDLLRSNPLPHAVADLSGMWELTSRMVDSALRAFREEDTAQAETVIRLDDQVDAMNAATFRHLLEQMATDPAVVTRAMALILVARSLERVADHATNICEEVFYLVEGEDIRHRP
jgi:phosphate transport system protein